ncbi:MAG: ABC transporter ATP-binding protein, partial [Kibdelosporangium sp.]
MRTLLGYTRQHWLPLSIGLVIALASAATGLAQPLATKTVMDAMAGEGSLTGPVLLLSVLIVVSALLAAAYTLLLDRTAEKIVF